MLVSTNNAHAIENQGIISSMINSSSREGVNTSAKNTKFKIFEKIDSKVVLRNFLLFILGCIMLYVFIYFNIKWGYIISTGLILFMVTKLFVFITSSLFLPMLLYFNEIKFYYYAHSLFCNLNTTIWSSGMIVISNIYFQGVNIPINMFDIESIYLKEILICLIFIGISNTMRLVIVDLILETPTYNKFKFELEYFLKLYDGIHTLFHTQVEGRNSINNINNSEDLYRLDLLPLPKKLYLPLTTLKIDGSNIYFDKNQILESIITVNVKTKKEAKLISIVLFNILDNFDSNLGVNLNCFLELVVDDTADKSGSVSNSIKIKNAKNKLKELFYIINTSESGFISREEFINVFEEMYSHYSKLSHGLITKKTINKALELVIGFCYFIIVFFICLMILRINIVNLYSSTITFLALSSFGLSTSITRFVESILYITVYREFEIGDYVKIGGLLYTVKKIKLFNTVFIGESGEVVFISNNILITLVVQNLSKSNNALVSIFLKINKGIDETSLKKIRNEVGLYLKKNKNEWSLEYDVFVSDLKADLSFILCINLKNNLSWKSHVKVLRNKSEFLLFIKKYIEKEFYGSEVTVVEESKE